MTFTELARDYLESARGGLGDASFANLRYNIENYVIPAYGDLDARSLSEGVMLSRALKMGGSGGNLSSLTRVKNFEIAKRVAKRGMKRGSVPVFLLDFYLEDSPRKGKTTDSFSDGEVKAFTDGVLKHLSGRTLGYLLSLCAGLRIGEVCGLHWGDIDIERRVIHAGRTVQRVPLDGGGTRLVVEPPEANPKKRDILMSQRLAGLVAGNFNIDEVRDMFLTTGKERPMEPRTYRRVFADFLRDCGIRGRPYKVLRLTYEAACERRAAQAVASAGEDLF